MSRQLMFLLIAFVLIFPVIGNDTHVSYAQTANLLADPGFEGPNGYKAVSIDPLDPNLYFTIPREWGGIVFLEPRTRSWQNAHPSGYPHTGPYKRSGFRSLHIARGYATFTVVLHQRVSVQPNSAVQGGVWAYMDTPQGLFRVGIDPNGGTNPGAGGVVWSNWAAGLNTWLQASVNATAGAGGTVTLFIQATQNQPSNPNGIYLDDAFLNGIAGNGVLGPDTGSGGATAGGTTTTPASNVPHVTSPVALRVRRGPSTDSERFGTILPGQSFPLTGQVGQWYQIDYNGQTGYVAAWIAQVTQGAAGGGSSAGAATGTLTASYRLNVRSGPGTNFGAIGHINAGEQRTITGSQDGWYAFDYNGQTGYVAGWLVTVN